jgi:hypothetical protein
MAFKPNRNLVSELKRGPEFQALLDEAARAVMTAAERESPIGFSEDYIHGFRLTKTPTTRRVGNTDFAAHLVEWGSVNNPAYSPLRRGVRAVGLRFDEASAV